MTSAALSTFVGTNSLGRYPSADLAEMLVKNAKHVKSGLDAVANELADANSRGLSSWLGVVTASAEHHGAPRDATIEELRELCRPFTAMQSCGSRP
jgi:hypothetical protein